MDTAPERGFMTISLSRLAVSDWKHFSREPASNFFTGQRATKGAARWLNSYNRRFSRWRLDRGIRTDPVHAVQRGDRSPAANTFHDSHLESAA